MNWSKLRPKILVGLSLVSIIQLAVCLAPTPAVAQLQTTFSCIQTNNGDFATVGQRGNRKLPPIIFWNRFNIFGGMSAEQRCQIVSGRLTQAIARNGGTFKNLWIRVGTVNRQSVICYVPKRYNSGCNAYNTILTLYSSDQGNEYSILSTLARYARGDATGSVVYRSSESDDLILPMDSLEEFLESEFQKVGQQEI